MPRHSPEMAPDLHLGEGGSLRWPAVLRARLCVHSPLGAGDSHMHVFSKLFLRAAAAAVVMSIANAASAGVVINEAYGGGGNSGSTYTNDFVELYNNTLGAIDIS